VENNRQELEKIIASDSSEWSSKDHLVIEHAIDYLDKGKERIARFDQNTDTWVVDTLMKEAILAYFKITQSSRQEVGPFVYSDKIPLKTNYLDLGVRVVPPAVARYGSYMEPGVVLMPSYVNIGAWVGRGTMVDTWATVGSCAQVGAGVHLSGGVGIGGVLEPASSLPVIIEDGAFLGSRAIVVEGVRIGKEAVLAANCTVTASTPIIDTRVSPFKRSKGYVPPRCVVVPGTCPKKINGAEIQTNCVYIIGERKESTNRKTSLNEVLRDYSLSV
jgi:2,3,4,5-tetrahydropyridine-2,6-dicarboxylate N-succinyltransferase